MRTMRTHILSKGRLLALTASDWLLLLGGIAICGAFLVLVFF
jgi:hypothetical protein